MESFSLVPERITSRPRIRRTSRSVLGIRFWGLGAAPFLRFEKSGLAVEPVARVQDVW